MSRIWTVALKNDQRSQTNLATARYHSLWGMKNKGIHQNIKKGDFVVFLVGVSIENIEDMRLFDVFTDKKNVFPNYKDAVLTEEFVEKFRFHVDEVLLGTIESDFFQNESEVWEPKVDNKGKKNFYINRFRWQLTHEARDILFSNADSNIDFHRNIIKALRSKRVEPSDISLNEIARIKSSMLKTNNVFSDEESYQNKILESSPLYLPDGGIPVNDATTISETKRWKRNVSVAKQAIVTAGFRCEIDPSHKTFTSKKTNNNFVEAHHLIPMEKQPLFSFNLDVPENILALCPNCHRHFHHADTKELREILSVAYAKRHELLKKREIGLSFESLESLYYEG